MEPLLIFIIIKLIKLLIYWVLYLIILIQIFINNNNLNTSELSLFYDYLDKNIFDVNQILILDRLYF
jgi:hypothetical protein